MHDVGSLAKAFAWKCALICALCVSFSDIARSEVLLTFGFGLLRSDTDDLAPPGSVWALVVTAPGSQLPGGLEDNSSLVAADTQAAKETFGGAEISPGSDIGDGVILATGQITDLSAADVQIQLSNQDFEDFLEPGGSIGFYWFPGIIGDTATLPESGFSIGGLQETVTDPASGSDAGMIVPSNNGQAITIAYFDADITGSPGSLPAERFTAIEIPASGYQVWRDLTFTEEQILTGKAEADADPDLDGLTNLIEYATASQPLVSNSGTLGLARTDSGVSLQFHRIADPELRYRVEATSDLSLSPWPDVVFESSGPANLDGIVEFTRPLAASGRRFFRLRVEHW